MRAWRLGGLLGLVLLGGMLPLLAQPMPDEAWLQVKVAKPDGTLIGGIPYVTLTKIVALSRINAGRSILTPEDTATAVGLTPGTYELSLLLQGYGLVDGPRQIEITNGPNEYIWRTPEIIPVKGTVTLNGQPATQKRVQAYLMGLPQPGYLIPVSASGTKGAFSLFGVFPGKYRLVLLTDVGYGSVEFEATAGQTAGVTPVVEVQPGGVAEITVANAEGEPVSGASVSLTRQLEKRLPLTVTLYTNAQGKAVTQQLPPGDWRWTVNHSRYAGARGTITVKAGEPNTTTVTLSQP